MGGQLRGCMRGAFLKCKHVYSIHVYSIHVYTYEGTAPGTGSIPGRPRLPASGNQRRRSGTAGALISGKGPAPAGANMIEMYS